MQPAQIALAAACGCAMLDVFQKPRMAVMATGDELVPVEAAPLPQQIRNSNTYSLAALVEEHGAEAVMLPVSADTREALLKNLQAARDCDLLLLSGGVSAGKYDLVAEVLRSLGAEFLFKGVAMQPGRPVVFGRLPATTQHPAQYFFGLPGNPISTEVTFLLFVAPLLSAMCGAGAQQPHFVQATLTRDIEPKPGLTRFLPARLTHDLTRPSVEAVTWQSSGDVAANARANCYAVIPPDQSTIAAGTAITVLLR
jgi:molybdopterin molybdotransferase